MRYSFFLYMIACSLFVSAQKRQDTTWKKEIEMVTFKIRPKPPVSDNSPNFNFRPQVLSLNEIFNQYRLTFKPHKEDPKNIQELLNYPIEKCVVSFVVKNFIRDYENWYLGVWEIRTLYPSQKVFFEKVQVRAPDGKYFYIKKVRAVKRG